MVDTDLTTALILLFNGREPTEIGAAIKSAAGDRMGQINQAIDTANRAVTMYSQDVTSIREMVQEEYTDYLGKDQEVVTHVLADHVTDDMIFAELQCCELPDSVYDRMRDVWQSLFHEWKSKGWIIDAPEVSDD